MAQKRTGDVRWCPPPSTRQVRALPEATPETADHVPNQDSSSPGAGVNKQIDKEEKR
jgi:hypothetical protein